MPADLLTSTEAGQILGCSGRTVLRMVEAGKIPIAHRMPGPKGALLFQRTVIQGLAAQRKSDPEQVA